MEQDLWWEVCPSAAGVWRQRDGALCPPGYWGNPHYALEPGDVSVRRAAAMTRRAGQPSDAGASATMRWARRSTGMSTIWPSNWNTPRSARAASRTLAAQSTCSAVGV